MAGVFLMQSASSALALGGRPSRSAARGCGSTSLVPGDPVLDMTDRLVAVTRPYQGRRRMTLTCPALARADKLLWLVTGASKHEALGRLLAGDRSIPAARVQAPRSVIFADAPAVHDAHRFQGAIFDV